MVTIHTGQLSPEVERFCVQTKRVAEANGVVFTLSPQSHIPYPSTGDLVNGYMVEFPTKQLAVATGKPVEQWLPILAHESSHLDQLLENIPVWKESYLPNTLIETIDVVQLWIENKIELTPEQLSTYIRRSRNVELDCEQRTAAKIAAFDLPIDNTEYIQKANSYIFFYTAMKETRSWYLPGKEPYNTPAVWSLCPTTFLYEEAYETVPEDLMHAYREILK